MERRFGILIFTGLKAPEDAMQLGLDDAFIDAVCLIEWPDRLKKLLPKTNLSIHLYMADGDDGGGVIFQYPVCRYYRAAALGRPNGGHYRQNGLGFAPLRKGLPTSISRLDYPLLVNGSRLSMLLLL